MIYPRIKELRESKGLTQQQTADTLNLALSTYRSYETGTREPSVEVLIQLSELYNVSLDWLLGLSEYRNSIEEIALSNAKEFGNKDSNAVEVYRQFLHCTDQYKVFYAECFGVYCSEDEEFQPQMCEAIYEHIKDVIASYNEMFDCISSCTTEEKFKECIIVINKCLDNITAAKNRVVEETYRLYTERNINVSAIPEQYARTAAYGGGTKNIPRPKKSGEELNKMVEEAEQNNILAEIRANKAKNKKS